MALKLIVAKIDDVDEKYRDLYTQKGDKWEFTGVEGIKTDADIKRLNDALIKERGDHKATSDKLKTTTEKLAGFGEEITPEAVQELKDKLATLEAAGTPELTKNFEKIVTDRVNAVIDGKVKQATDKLNKDLVAAQTQVGTLTKDNETFKQNDLHRTIDDAVREAANAAKILPGAQVDALIRARTSFTVQDGKVVTQDGMTPADWIEKRKEDAAHWWPVAKGTGAHGSDGAGNFQDGQNPFLRANWNVTKQGELTKADPTKAARLAEQAGVKLGATAPAAEQK